MSWKIKITWSEWQTEKHNLKKANSLRDIQHNIKCSSIYIIGSQKKRDRRGQKCILWNYSWKLPKPEERNRYPGTGSTEVPKQDEPNRTTPRHIVIKKAKVKERILKTTWEKWSHIQRNLLKLVNFEGQKGVAWYIQSAEMDKPAT